MEIVDPIRDKKKIKDLKKYLKGEGNMRNYCLVFLGMNVALRISDLLKLKWGELINEDHSIKDCFYTREKKTGKYKDQRINAGAKEAIKLYLDTLDGLDLNQFVFKSRQVDKVTGDVKALDRRSAWRIIKSSCDGVGIKGRIGTHTLRKTWGYWAYNSGVDIVKIMEALNHSTTAITKRYIGITQDDINNAYDLIVF